MKSQKGITMLTLVVYVASFLVVAGIVGAITTYFYNNMSLLNGNSASSADYNKLNVYIMKQAKTSGVQVSGKTDNPKKVNQGSDESVKYITFKLPNGTENTFCTIGDILYFNKIKLCENVTDFTVDTSTNGDKQSVTITVVISNIQYKTTYALES